MTNINGKLKEFFFAFVGTLPIFTFKTLKKHAFGSGRLNAVRHSMTARRKLKQGRTGISIQVIEGKIYLIRKEQVMLDSDLATMYGVTTKSLNQQVRRNRSRFPSDFMFQLTARETSLLRSQFVTSNRRGGRRYRPLVFTEQGVAMLSSVLNSERAIQVNIAIMRTFAKLRRLLSTNKDLAVELKHLEKKFDSRFNVVFDAIRKLMEPQIIPPQRRIGFR